ncbi:MAG: hypothetical protein RMH84_03380 [Sulfolobales archaeon]|nr:hypothetical protein [Sulfolobales archaeon]MCX8208194.1 hypothetical protein [Sulfolobales archaeon]MDW8010619.1 hypothetical protein [Sulfolobales archaeon]
MTTPTTPTTSRPPTFEELFLDFARSGGVPTEIARRFLDSFRSYVEYYFYRNREVLLRSLKY